MSNSYVYTGKPIVPNFELNLGNTPLQKDIDYEMFIENNVNVGTATVHIMGKGKFTGTMEHTFNIEPVPAKNLQFYADSTVFDYTGEPIKMQLAVKFGDEIQLTEGKDYTIAYMDNVEIGRATAQMTFKGNFNGIMNIPFLIKSPFVNTSVLSSSELEFGSDLTVYAHAEGGKKPYSYSFYSRHSDDTKWHKLSDYTPVNEFTFTPVHIKDYVLLSRIKDSDGRITDAQLPFSVVSLISGECKTGRDSISLGESTILSVDMKSGEAPFIYSYLVRFRGTNKWIALKKSSSIPKMEFQPKRSGVYDICVKVNDSQGHRTKIYTELTVK